MAATSQSLIKSFFAPLPPPPPGPGRPPKQTKPGRPPATPAAAAEAAPKRNTRDSYQALTLSGCHLLRIFATDAKAATLCF